MKPLGVHLTGRLGNQMFQYAYARAVAEREGRALHTNDWVGQRVFEVLADGGIGGNESEMLPEHYRQDQGSLIYTRKDVRRWFRVRREVAELLRIADCGLRIVGHVRRGDYLACGYPVVSELSIYDAVYAAGLDVWQLEFVSEENPTVHPEFTGELSWVPDFWRMMTAEVLFRSNSTFSWWAGTLGNGRVFAPVIEGLRGGVEHDEVRFVEGNWPRCAELPCVTDLHLEEG